MTLWFLLAILNPIVWAFTNIIDKFVLSKVLKDPWVPTISFSAFGFLGALIILIVKGFTNLSWAGWLWVLILGPLYLAAEYFYYRATERDEISRVISLVYTSPLFVALFAAIFLHEVFSFVKYVGIALVIFGAIGISYRSSAKKMAQSAFWLCVISAILFAIHDVVAKELLGSLDFLTTFAYVRIMSFITLVPIIFVRRAELLQALPQEFGLRSLIAFNGFLTILGAFLFISALSLGPATLTAAIGASQPFFVLALTVLIGFFYPRILKESGGGVVFAQKLIAIALMFTGVVLISP